MGYKILIGTTEVLVAKETMPGREGRRMSRGKYQVTRTVNKSPLFLGISPPEDKDKPLAFGSQGADGGISKLLPPLALMATRLMGTHREGCIQKKHSLIGPTGQITCHRDGSTQITFYFLEYVD